MARLDAATLHRTCDPTAFDFDTTRELEDLEQIVGQERAIAAIRFGIGIEGVGFNIFAMGPSGIGKHHVIGVFLDECAPSEDTPPSWCYVHNFEEPGAPRAIALAPGRASAARDTVNELLVEIEVAVRSVVEGADFRQRRRELDATFDARHEAALDAVAAAADEQGLVLEQTANGFAIIPIVDGEPATPELVATLDDAEQNRIDDARDEVSALLRTALEEFPTWERERQHAVRDLQAAGVVVAVAPMFERARDDFFDSDEFVEHLRDFEASVVRDPSPFVPADDVDRPTFEYPQSLGAQRFGVNIVVDHDAEAGAPVVYQDDPTWENLHGRVEYDGGMGGLTTNFALIRGGSLHQANGGYLVVDARKLLADPHSWEELKRTLYAREIRVPSRSESALAPRALSLDPDPIPLAVKVIMVGERETYYALRELDPDMDELFKVMADFDTHVPRTDDNVLAYARFVARIAQTDDLRPLDRFAVARVVDEGARMAQHSGRLSTQMRLIEDLVSAADYWAAADECDVVGAAHVERALSEERARNGRLRDAMLEELTSELINVATSGETVGEINGLSVIHFGASAFGRPTRISVGVSPGRELIDIEREADLGGPIHSKGVMLLAGFLAHRYGADAPLTLSATIAFEQSYGPIDGDSASAAETCALLSALSGLPIKQSFAMTGALDQRGRIQAVGGVDDKIEGFFEICRLRGLDGIQGVLIPQANAASLMLRRDVVDAVERGEFGVYAVATIDDAMALLTGLSADEIDRRVRDRLKNFALAWSKSRFSHND